jgi:hypothetical protein
VTSSADGLRGLQQVADSISRQAVGQAPDGGPDQVLLLLLRSSGDERTEEMRVGVLRTFGQRLASLAGWTPDAADGDDLLLRAQLVLSVGIGIAVLRSARGLEPIASATAEQLSEPVHALVTAVLADQRR